MGVLVKNKVERFYGSQCSLSQSSSLALTLTIGIYRGINQLDV